MQKIIEIADIYAYARNHWRFRTSRQHVKKTKQNSTETKRKISLEISWERKHKSRHSVARGFYSSFHYYDSFIIYVNPLCGVLGGFVEWVSTETPPPPPPALPPYYVTVASQRDKKAVWLWLFE